MHRLSVVYTGDVGVRRWVGTRDGGLHGARDVMSTVVEPSERAMHAEKEPQVGRREVYRVGPNGAEVLHAEVTGEHCRASGDVLDLGFKRVAVSLTPYRRHPT